MQAQAADEKFKLPTLDSALDPPDWLHLEGENRVRYESLDGQFRAGRNGSDQLLAIRTLIRAKAKLQPFDVNLELQDSRGYLDDAGTPLSTSFVNSFEFINANLDFHLGKTFGEHTNTKLKLGRQTVDIGSERFIERNGYRNTINSYDGAHLRTHFDSGNQFESFFVVPVRAQPRNFENLSDNRQAFDKRDDSRGFWGVVYTDEKNLIPDTKLELFTYGLHERDTNDRNTANRELYTLGFRTLKKPKTTEWDYEVEYGYQFGERRATTASTDTNDINVRAQTLHAEIGYQFDAPWTPRLAFEFDYATGDDNPNDNRFGSYDRLFGARRGDVGFTSIHGPLVRNNLILPGIDFEFQPNKRTDGFITYQVAYLDSDTDELDAANLRDVTGNSGRFIGHTIDARVRHWIVPKRVRWDIGGSALFHGNFLDNVPNGPEKSRTLYGFSQLVTKF